MRYHGHMAGTRSYGGQCGVARSLDVIGERWALLIVRELLLGPKRFNDLLALQGTADPARVTGRYQLAIGADTFTVDGSSGTVRIRRGTADQPDATAATDVGTFHAVVFGQRPAADAIASGDLRLDGDPAAAGRLTDLLLALTASAPQPVPAAGA